MVITATLTLVSLLVLPSSIVAQGTDQRTEGLTEKQQERQPLGGRILDVKGQPVAGAEVHLVSNLVAGLPDLGQNDEISIVSDIRGRFRARLMPGRTYSAWAWHRRKDGSRWTSPIRENVRPGPTMDLRLTMPQPDAKLSLLPAADGRVFGKALYTFGGSNFVLRKIGKAERENRIMPRLAGSWASLRLFDKGGRPIDDHLLLPSRGSMVLTLSPCRTVSIRAVFGSQPIAGAKVLIAVNNWLKEIATTDEDGYARFPISGSLDTRDDSFQAGRGIMVLKPGYAATRAYVNGRADTQGKIPTVEVLLMRGRRLQGRWLDSQGNPIASMPLALFINYDQWRGGNPSLDSGTLPLAFHTDAQGRFDLPGLNRQSAWRLVAFPPDADSPVLVSSSSKPPEGDIDLGDLRLEDFVRLDLRVSSAEHRPVPDALLALGEAGSPGRHNKALDYPLWLTPDRLGRASLLCRKGLRPAFAAASQGGLVELELETPISGDRPIPVELRLPKLIHLRGRLLHSDIDDYDGGTVRIYRNGGGLNVSRMLGSSYLHRVKPDGSFDIQVLPGSKVRLQASYIRRTSDGVQRYYSTPQRRVYEEDRSDIELELIPIPNRVKVLRPPVGAGRRR